MKTYEKKGLPMSISNFANNNNTSKASNAASAIPPQERKRLAIEAMARTSTISHLASAADTSRKFIYAQKQKDGEKSRLIPFVKNKVINQPKI